MSIQNSNGEALVSNAVAFQEALNVLGSEMILDGRKWFPALGNRVDLNMLVLGLNGEAGEVADVLKKVLRNGGEFTEEAKEEIKEEMIDVFIYWCQLFVVLDMNFFDEYDRKRAFNEERWGSASSDDSAV